jgi:phage tail tape-measure protein
LGEWQFNAAIIAGNVINQSACDRSVHLLAEGEAAGADAGAVLAAGLGC